jgi:hypothetical protein
VLPVQHFQNCLPGKFGLSLAGQLTDFQKPGLVVMTASLVVMTGTLIVVVFFAGIGLAPLVDHLYCSPSYHYSQVDEIRGLAPFLWMML